MDKYDVFENLEELCNNNMLENLRKIAHDENEELDVDIDFDNELDLEILNRLGTVEVKGQKQKIEMKNRKRPSPSKRLLDAPSTSNSNIEIANEAAPINTSTHLTRRSRSTMTTDNLIEVFDLPQENPNESLRRSSRRTRARRQNGIRNNAAELAARSTNVEYVDLVTSPIPRIEGIVNVDSDSEDLNILGSPKDEDGKISKIDSLDLSFDEENPEMSIKIIWNGIPEVFKLRKHQKFSRIFEILADREKTKMENLVLNLNNKIITSNDTPSTVDYKIFQFINGRILNSESFKVRSVSKKNRDNNKITIKIQSDKWKRPLEVELLKTDKFKILYIKCSEELNMPYENYKLSFDGDILEYNKTPIDLELEGGEAIDLCFKK